MLTKPRVLLTLSLVALVALTSLTPVLADVGMPGANGAAPANTGGGWGDFYDNNGNLLPGVIQGGEISMPADWMPSFPDWTGIQMDATYHVLTSPNGSTMLVPSATTLFMMALNPVESGLTDASGALGSGLGGVLLGGGLVGGGNVSLADLVSALTGMSYVNAQNFADAVIAGDGSVWSLMNPFGGGDDVFNILRRLAELSLADGNLYLAAFLYESCLTSPTGCPEELCIINPEICGLPTPEPPDDDAEPTPTPLPTCPWPTISQAAPVLTINPTAPNYPIAVGQDPDQRGVDISASVSIPPVIYTWWEPQYEEEEQCRASGSGPSDCTRPNGSPGWTRTVPVLVDCEMRQEIYPERITQFIARSQITPGSADWIVNTLGAQWYGAQVKQASFDLTRFGTPNIGCGGGGTCYANLTALHVPYADPGFHTLTVRVGTAGTPVTTPRVLNTTGEVGVWVILPTLINANP
jgi:hypothetical protein